MRRSVLAAVLLTMGAIPAYAEHPAAMETGSLLSGELRALLLAEMRLLATATQSVAVALTAADWATIARVSGEMRASYILERELTPAQREELERVLPVGFVTLDRAFHQRAAKLGAAAEAEDAERATFQFYRLLESCAGCHAQHARERFPGFHPEIGDAHRH